MAQTDDDTVEAQVCEAVGPELVKIQDVLEELKALIPELNTDVTESRTALDGSTVELANSALAYIRALDTPGETDDKATLEDLIDDATVFGIRVNEWIEAVDAQAANAKAIGLYEVVEDYLKGICPSE